MSATVVHSINLSRSISLCNGGLYFIYLWCGVWFIYFLLPQLCALLGCAAQCCCANRKSFSFWLSFPRERFQNEHKANSKHQNPE